jgi:hypothetical protein
MMERLRDSAGRFDRRPTASMAKRFEAQTHPEPNTGCWLHEGSPKNAYGHAAFKLGGRGTPVEFAHRVAYRLAYGEIPNGKMVLHTCDTACCVNPAHLYAGTAKDNARDMLERNRACVGERSIHAVLTADIVRIIRAENLRPFEAAKRFGISRQSAADCKYGRTWKHVH